MKYPIFQFLSLFLFHRSWVQAIFDDYRVELSNDGPAVIGSNITFTAVLYKNGKKSDEDYFYVWRDNLYPQNKVNITAQSESNWTVNYPRHIYTAGFYEVEVTVEKKWFKIDWPVVFSRRVFSLTDTLVGELVSKQNITPITPGYFSNAIEIFQEINLTKPNVEFLKNVSSVITYWFIDCVPIANTTDLFLRYNYTKADVSHSITAFVVASNNTMSSEDMSTEVDIISSTGTPMQITSASNETNSTTDNTKFSYETINTSLQSVHSMPPPLFSCPTKKVVPMDKNYTYGLYNTKIKIKAPVQNVQVQGTGWLQHGEMLDLLITCNGSAPFSFCFRTVEGDYNVTGHETCPFYEATEPNCEFHVARYFGDSTRYTVILILTNDINKDVIGFGVDVYEVTKHPQVSVIIIPVTAALLAVILIVFGIAYYIQNRDRYIVEVADFDFSNTSDMEYKTFRERLIEAVHNALNRTEEFSEQDSYSEPSTNKRYGSMQ